jgi:hypothetical protein
MKNFKLHVSSWLLIILFLVGSVLYPSWLMDGYLDNLYLKIMVFITCYGGLIASIIWYINFIKESK